MDRQKVKLLSNKFIIALHRSQVECSYFALFSMHTKSQGLQPALQYHRFFAGYPIANASETIERIAHEVQARNDFPDEETPCRTNSHCRARRELLYCFEHDKSQDRPPYSFHVFRWNLYAGKPREARRKIRNRRSRAHGSRYDRRSR
jgi:hypothetical protein